MMKAITIAFKDLSHTFRSPFSLVMMFGAPLLITGLLYFAFGSLVSNGSGTAIPVTRVQVANLDQPAAQTGGLAAGRMLVDFLQSEDLKDVVAVTIAIDEASARAAVDKQNAGVTIIIPPDFSQAILTADHRASVTIYQDPTLSIGPGIVKDLVNHFLDGFSGSKIAANVTVAQLKAQNVAAGSVVAAGVAQQYAAWLQASEHGQDNDTHAGITIASPSGEEQALQQSAGMIGTIMAGMMIFFVYFMGANGAESIVQEDEDGTLARLFTTPTSQATILGGKFMGVLIALILQTLVLLAASMLIFRINWGQPLTIGLVTVGMIVAATGFGVMVMSFIKNTRQTGPVLGGVLVVTGMLGGLFTNGIPNLPPAFNTVTLSMPQGWAMQAWKLTLSNADPLDALLSTGVMFLLGIVFFAVGVLFFRRRFA
jgi:ABC-2 type transport system permease protein